MFGRRDSKSGCAPSQRRGKKNGGTEVPPSLGRKRPRHSAQGALPRSFYLAVRTLPSKYVASQQRITRMGTEPALSGPSISSRQSAPMLRPAALALLLALPWLVPAPPALAQGIGGGESVGGAAGALCDVAVASAERALHVPDEFLSAIARVESGRPGPAGVQPWPWTLNVEGQGHFYATKAEAIAAVQAFQAQGARSIDVGCMQVNLMHHPDAFASLDQALDPLANALWAGRFLQTLFAQFGSWPLAAGAYHSQTPGLGAPYMQRVLETWATPEHESPGGGARAHGMLSAGARAGLPRVIEPSAREAMAAAPLAPGAGMVPMGGGARIIRDPALAPAQGANQGLSAYRARPIALAGGFVRMN